MQSFIKTALTCILPIQIHIHWKYLQLFPCLQLFKFIFYYICSLLFFAKWNHSFSEWLKDYWKSLRDSLLIRPRHTVTVLLIALCLWVWQQSLSCHAFKIRFILICLYTRASLKLCPFYEFFLFNQFHLIAYKRSLDLFSKCHSYVFKIKLTYYEQFVSTDMLVL